MSTSPSSPDRSLPLIADAGEDETPGTAAPLAWTMRPLRLFLARLLARLQFGTLAIELPGGERLEGRGPAPGPHACVALHRWRPLVRLLMQGDIGLARAYRDGDWSTPDLAALLELGIRNEAAWSDSLNPTRPSRWLHRLRHLARGNSRRGSRDNIAFHYDLGNEFYRQWLDAELNYSSGVYTHGDEPLEAAQAAKRQRVVELMSLPPQAARVLEIGCGWGGLALALARDHGAHVTGLTLSSEQLAHARRCAAREGLDGQLDLRLQDYRDVEGHYDRIVSIEMLEAVGERYWPVYFDTLRERLAPDGLAVLQVITIADAHFDGYRANADFIQHFIFPGGMLPSWTVLQAQAARAGMTIERDQTFGDSYATTLAQWRSRFQRAWPAIRALGFDDAFRRLWEYYLCYCEAGFRTGRIDVGLYTLRRATPAE
ncbi:cyclopropane-fatty-acyl-phospholipid synthase family protein [Variovorax sp. KK3]|uniref:SAM-dependent methyltransferase n=1 Tax=Variovorax sp. KK3 TaxID=1855728 RepID=UPI00097C41EA|nr:cyclopropane-fatty-acyl-phospholipid synthase family protein [Variovorax sp. KK3]